MAHDLAAQLPAGAQDLLDTLISAIGQPEQFEQAVTALVAHLKANEPHPDLTSPMHEQAVNELIVMAANLWDELRADAEADGAALAEDKGEAAFAFQRAGQLIDDPDLPDRWRIPPERRMQEEGEER